MSEPHSTPTEPVEEEIHLPQDPVAKIKKPRTDAQKTALEQARLKAMAVRKENAELRKAEKEVEKMEKQQALAERKEKVKNALRPSRQPGLQSQNPHPHPSHPSPATRPMECMGPARDNNLA